MVDVLSYKSLQFLSRELLKNDQDRYARISALTELGMMDVLSAGLKSTDWMIRAESARVIEVLADTWEVKQIHTSFVSKAMQGLTDAIHTETSLPGGGICTVLFACVAAIGKIGPTFLGEEHITPETITALEAALKYPNSAFKAHTASIIEALAGTRWGAKLLTPETVKALDDAIPKDSYFDHDDAKTILHAQKAIQKNRPDLFEVGPSLVGPINRGAMLTGVALG